MVHLTGARTVRDWRRGLEPNGYRVPTGAFRRVYVAEQGNSCVTRDFSAIPRQRYSLNTHSSLSEGHSSVRVSLTTITIGERTGRVDDHRQASDGQ